MSYYTRFSLQIQDELGEPVPARMAEALITTLINENQHVYYALHTNGFSRNPTMWYKWAVELVEFSKLHPKFLFVLTGKGDEDEDYWRAFFLAGNWYKVYAERVLPKFDPDVMENTK